MICQFWWSKCSTWHAECSFDTTKPKNLHSKSKKVYKFIIFFKKILRSKCNSGQVDKWNAVLTKLDFLKAEKNCEPFSKEVNFNIKINNQNFFYFLVSVFFRYSVSSRTKNNKITSKFSFLEHLFLWFLNARKGKKYYFCWNFFPKLRGSILSSGTQSTVSYLRRTYQKKSHQFLFLNADWPKMPKMLLIFKDPGFSTHNNSPR